IGYLGYGLRRAIERLPSARPDPLDQADAWFGFYDRAVIFDHERERVVAVVARREDATGRDRAARLTETRRSVAAAARIGAAGAPARLPAVEATPATTRGAYLRAV